MKRRIAEILDAQRGAKRNSLIPILQEIQESEGFLSQEAVSEVGSRLGIPTSKIYGVATFYNQFTFSPRGYYHVVLCNGSSCHLSGAEELVKEIGKLLEIKDGETTRDGLFSLEVQSCIGACGQAPVVSVNGEYYTNVTIKKIRDIEQEVIRKGETQLFIEAPYRNDALLADILDSCRPATLLCIAADITLETEFIKTLAVATWKRKKPALHKRPVMFLLGK